jgi:hypothetical protein
MVAVKKLGATLVVVDAHSSQFEFFVSEALLGFEVGNSSFFLLSDDNKVGVMSVHNEIAHLLNGWWRVLARSLAYSLWRLFSPCHAF